MPELLRTNSNNKDFKSLVELLDAELLSRYPDIQAQYAPHNKIEQNNTVVVAYVNNEAVACGCFKEYDNETVEVKRMFVKNEHRGNKISYAILQALEAWAKELAFKRIVLETGSKQPEALGLYIKYGYKKIDNYGPYVDLPDSICFEKLI